MKKDIIVDKTRARYYCTKCSDVEYCDRHLRAEFPPDATKKALKKRHKNCSGKLEYSCGFLPPRCIVGQSK